MVALISESCESLVQRKSLLRYSIPVGLIYYVLPSLWQIWNFAVGLIVPLQFSYKNLIPFLLCELVTFVLFYRRRTLPEWVLRGSFRQGKWAQLVVVERFLPRHRLQCLRLQWKSLVFNRATPFHYLWLPCVRDHLPSPEREQ